MYNSSASGNNAWRHLRSYFRCTYAKLPAHQGRVILRSISMFFKSAERRFREVTNIAFELLDGQRIFVSKEEFVIADRDGRINGKALGYLFGFLDALLQSARLDIRSSNGEASVYSLLSRLFPAEVTMVGTYVHHLKTMSNDPEIMNGVMLGGKQAVDWLRHKATPVRWATCYSAELARLSEERDRKHGV